MATRLVLAGFDPPREIEISDAPVHTEAASVGDRDEMLDAPDPDTPVAFRGEGTTLLALLRRARVPIGQACRGQGICRACIVEVLGGREHLVTASLGPVMTPTVLACTVGVWPTAPRDGYELDRLITLHSPHWG